MIFAYEAVDSVGTKRQDVLDVRSSQDAIEKLRSQGLFVTSIIEKSADSVEADNSALSADDNHKFSLGTLALITRQLAMLLKSGSGIVAAFNAIHKQTKNAKHRAVIAKIVVDLEEGVSLSESLRKFPRCFDAVYCAIISAGEASGTLSEMLDRLATIVGKQRVMKKKVIGALAYPVLLTAMCTNIIAGLLIFVLPRFAVMFDELGIEAPASTKLMLSAGAFLTNNWYFVLAGIALLIAVVVWTVRSKQGRAWICNMQTEVPIIGNLRRKLIQAQVLRTMGMLTESQVGLLDSLDLARGATRNRRFQKLFDDLFNAVTSGGSMSATFEESQMVDSFVCQAIHTGEDSGNLGGAMCYCADSLDESNVELIDVIMKLLEPTILIGMGVVVGAVAISLFLPLFDLTSAIN